MNAASHVATDLGDQDLAIGWLKGKPFQILAPSFILFILSILHRREKGLTYSTCSSAPETCPDKVCDSLESLNDSICPQDCVNKDNIMMKMLYMNTSDPTWNYGFGSVTKPDMICTCQGYSCSCIHKKNAHPILPEEDESSLGSTDSNSLVENEPICGFWCLGTIFGIAAISIITSVFLLTKKRYLPNVILSCLVSQI